MRFLTMAALMIDDAIAERLHEIAQRESRPLDAVIHTMLETYPAVPHASDWPLLMVRMAETDITWNENASDQSERSREILDSEFRNYLFAFASCCSTTPSTRWRKT